MKNKVFAKHVLLLIFIQAFSASVFAAPQADIDLNQALEEAKDFCQKKVDPMVATMAKQAGYDVEKLCQSLNQLSLSAEQSLEQAEVPKRSDEPKENQQQQGDHQLSLEPSTIQAGEQSNLPKNTPLKLFGYDLFAGEPDTFEPIANAPVELDYLLGPGDELNIQFYGKVNDYFEQTILRDGTINFPKIGPVGVAGMSYTEAKQLINRKVAEEYIGVKVSVSLGSLRSMQIFVFGEAYKPGRYTVPSLSTITNALYLSGGVSEIASLRNIQIKRNGKIQARLDLYDLLLSGDRSKDIRLQSGDTIFIPAVEQTAGIEGQVRRPAIYELMHKPTVGVLIDLAGGLLPKAYQPKARIKRVDSTGFMTVVDVDLKTAKGLNTRIKNGDLLVIEKVAEESNNTVKISGNIHHPGEFLWREDLMVADLIPDADGFKPNTDLHFALLRRELIPTGEITTLFVNLADILADTQSTLNYFLQPKDELMVFANQQDRAWELSQLVMQLKQQSRMGEVAKVVTISGAVQSPGEYPLTANMTLTQLILAAGGLQEQAYQQSIELARSDFSDGERVISSHQSINLAAILSGNQPDISLSSYDQINIRNLPDYMQEMTITLAGEVLLPGKYSFSQGETLSDVVARAGGLTQSAYVNAAIFTRETLREREIQKIQLLREQVEADIASVNLQGEDGVSKDSEQKILKQLDTEKALGRLVIDLEGILNKTTPDIALKNGDHLMIPDYRQEVSVMGEVPWPSAHQHNEQLGISDYIDLAGGTKASADKSRIYVVKVDGSVRIPKGSAWKGSGKFIIEPGDTVVVPMDMDKKSSLTLWSEVTRIIYQLSLGATALKSL